MFRRHSDNWLITGKAHLMNQAGRSLKALRLDGSSTACASCTLFRTKVTCITGGKARQENSILSDEKREMLAARRDPHAVRIVSRRRWLATSLPP